MVVSTERKRRRRSTPEERANAHASIAAGLMETLEVEDARYPLEKTEFTGQSTPGNRPGGRTGGAVGSLTEAFAQNQHTTTDRLHVRRQRRRDGKTTYEPV